MSKKIVLLDVDNTLLYGVSGQINEALIDALIHAGITQVYFFTMNGLKDIRSYGQSIACCSRYDLVAYMRERGIHVLNVVSVSDRYFHPSAERAGAFYQDIYIPLMERRIQTREPLDLKDASSVDTLDYAFGDLACEIAITLVNRQMHLRDGERAEVPRRGLRLIHNVTQEEGAFFSQEEARQFFAIDSHRQQYHLDYRDNLDDMMTIVGSSSQNEKGIMLEHFLSIPGIVEKDSTIYFFEDKIEHIDGVTAAIENYNRIFKTEVKLYTCLMPETYEKATHKIFKAAYAQCLNGRSITDKLMVAQEPFVAGAVVDSPLLNLAVFSSSSRLVRQQTSVEQQTVSALN